MPVATRSIECPELSSSRYTTISAKPHVKCQMNDALAHSHAPASVYSFPAHVRTVGQPGLIGIHASGGDGRKLISSNETVYQQKVLFE